MWSNPFFDLGIFCKLLFRNLGSRFFKECKIFIYVLVCVLTLYLIWKKNPVQITYKIKHSKVTDKHRSQPPTPFVVFVCSWKIASCDSLLALSPCVWRGADPTATVWTRLGWLLAQLASFYSWLSRLLEGKGLLRNWPPLAIQLRCWSSLRISASDTLLN